MPSGHPDGSRPRDWASHLGDGCIREVLSDAQEVVSAIRTDSYLDSAAGHLVEEIKSLAELNFIAFSVF